jgi:tripeptidyl-peptidase I
VETGTKEIVCSSDTSASITSGGGFSILHVQPSFQTEAVAQYFVTAAADNKTPIAGYSAAGRGFPDVSLAGSNYYVYIGGLIFAVSGTSASAPVMAGLLSSINAARIASGKGSVGWVNPALYTNSSLFVNDITSGNSKCASNPGRTAPNCCTQGFYATAGWDPVTGLGSINYGKMVASFSALGAVNTAIVVPSKAPSTKSSSNSCHSYGKYSFDRGTVS